jgi:hypothetical protein
VNLGRCSIALLLLREDAPHFSEAKEAELV